MRDAYGGAFMLRVLIVFLAVFISFIAISINYAKAFRTKNAIINIIEQNEGIDPSEYSTGNGAVFREIDEYLSSLSYNYPDIAEHKCPRGTNFGRGYCIEEYDYEDDRYSDYRYMKKYYKVTTFIVIRLPIFENWQYTIPIKGETRMIERINA